MSQILLRRIEMKRLVIALLTLFLFSTSVYAQMGMMDMKMGTNDCQAKLKCAEVWLKKAIDLHEMHIKDPKTATEASQMEMMDQMKKAYECITGSKTDMHENKDKQKGNIPHKH